MSSAELPIKLGIIMIVLVAFGVGLYFAYKEYEKQCPDGFMKCFGFEDPTPKINGPTTPTPTPTPTSGGVTTPSPSDRSPDYPECTKQFAEDDAAKKCYNAAAGSGGLRWYWANTTAGKNCKAKAAFYKITASTAMDDHKLKYEYIKPGGAANGFQFNGASHLTSGSGKTYNMLLNVTPLDKDKKALTNPLMGQELNTKSTSGDCSDIGTNEINFSDFFKAVAPPPPPPPPPVNCEGTWSSPSACVAGSNPTCGDMGKITKTFTVSKQPQYGGTSCPPTEEKTNCIVTENCTPSTVPPEKLPSCLYGPWQNDTVASNLGVAQLFPDNDPYSSTDGKGGTTQAVCTKQWRVNASDPPGKRKQFRAITNVNFVRGQKTVGCIPQPASGDADDPLKTERTFDCNENYYKPIDCQGGWEPISGNTALCYDVKHTSRNVGNRVSNSYVFTYHPLRRFAQTAGTGINGGKKCDYVNGHLYIDPDRPASSEKKTTNSPNRVWANHPCSKLNTSEFPSVP